MTQFLLDQFLAACVSACLQDEPAPAWPTDWPDTDNPQITERIKFHGIALLLANRPATFADWPKDPVAAVREEARMQAIWEVSHQRALVPLIAALDAARIRPAFIKGTALAYSAYADPAVRRRGDTDILFSGVSKPAVRSVLETCGFVPSGERGPTQEPWSFAARGGFRHEVDIHWRISGALAIAEALERLRPESRIVALPRLSPLAYGLGAVDNLILTCVNRAAHDAFGYYVENARPADGDRLIWALDIHLVTTNFTDPDWSELVDLARSSGSATVVASGLLFAGARLGAMAPGWVLDRLNRPGSHQPVGAYYGASSNFQRWKSSMKSSASLGEKMALLQYETLRGRRFMNQRYPDAQHWPLWVLHIRRLAEGALRLLGLRA